MQDNIINFDKINPFGFKINYDALDLRTRRDIDDHHVHQECEIYINISGDVSFMVEDRIYPISSGNVIITRPYEYHHCIYNSDAVHKHYWILFDPGGNEKFLDLFFKRKAGENNLIALSPEDGLELIGICRSMLDSEISDAEQYFNFFRMIGLLNSGQRKKSINSKLPSELVSALDIINKNPGMPITVSQLADEVHVSINTLERYFKNNIGMTPTDYIRQKRLSLSAVLLTKGYSVRDACEMSGFPDYSHFIALFKKNFGMTPLKYKKA